MQEKNISVIMIDFPDVFKYFNENTILMQAKEN